MIHKASMLGQLMTGPPMGLNSTASSPKLCSWLLHTYSCSTPGDQHPTQAPKALLV